MLGYMTKSEAKELGFTHNGSYYGIPCWLGDIEGDFMVAAKWLPLESLMTVFHYIEGFLQMATRPDDEHGFQFTIKEEIK